MEPEAPKTETPATEPSAIVKAGEVAPVETEKKKVSKAEADDQTFLMATNPYMMGKAQKQLIAWAERKIASLQIEAKDHLDNLTIAKKNKVRTDAYARYLDKTTKKIEFYEKVKAALVAGYCVIPDMDVELFAIRTTRKNPKANTRNTESEVEGWQHHPTVADQESNRPALGDGRYVDVRPFTKTKKNYFTSTKSGKEMLQRVTSASDFDETVDFPFKLAKPAILETAVQAMALKAFDEIGVLPRTRRQPDPVVVGRVTFKDGYRVTRFNFLIAWFLDTKDL